MYELIGIAVILVAVAVLEVRAHKRHDVPVSEHTIEVRRMADRAKPIRRTQEDA